MLHHLSPVYTLHAGCNAPSRGNLPLLHLPDLRLTSLSSIWYFLPLGADLMDCPDAGDPIQVQDAWISIPPSTTTVYTGRLSTLGILLGILQHRFWRALVLQAYCA